MPPLDPPYEDELLPVTWAYGPAGQLALDLGSASNGRGGRQPTGAAVLPDRLGVPDPGRTPGAAGATPVSTGRLEVARVPSPTSATPEARHAARRFLDSCLEVVNGHRAATQVRALTSPATAHTLIEQLTAATARLRGPGHRPDQTMALVRLRVLRVCEPRPGVVEAAAVLGRGGRTWALAFRLERQRGSWLGTTAQLL